MAECEDAVSRQAVIDMTGLSEWFDSSDSYNEFVIALSDLQSVTPTRNKGKWIYDYSNYVSKFYHCSECGRKLALFNDNWLTLSYYPYCHCGCRMKGENQ